MCKFSIIYNTITRKKGRESQFIYNLQLVPEAHSAHTRIMETNNRYKNKLIENFLTRWSEYYNNSVKNSQETETLFNTLPSNTAEFIFIFYSGPLPWGAIVLGAVDFANRLPN